MIVWKLVCVVFIFDYVNSLSEDGLFEEDYLKDLPDLIFRWFRTMHRFPEAQWMFNSFPHFKFKHLNNDVFPGFNILDDTTSELPNGVSSSYLTEIDYIHSTRSAVNTSTDEEDKYFSVIDTTTTIKHDEDSGNDSLSTKISTDNYVINTTYIVTDDTNGDDFIQTSYVTDKGSSDKNNATVITETDYSWNENDTEIIINEIVQLLKNNTGVIKEVEEFIKRRNTKCNKDLWYAVRSLIDKHETIKMLDAAGKPASGISRGNIQWLGDYRQCQDISIPVRLNDGSLGGFNGLYCYTSWNASLESMGVSAPLVIGICIPDSCSAEDLNNDNKDIKDFLKTIPIFNKIKSPLHLNDVTCQDYSRKWSRGDTAYMIVLSLFAVLIVAGTVCDLLKRKNKQTANTQKVNSRPNRNEDIPDVVIPNEATAIAIGKERVYGDDVPLSVQSTPTLDEAKQLSGGGLSDFLICFSVYTNASKVLTVGNQQAQIGCLHGIRFLSLSWVIFGHVFIYAMNSVGNIVDILEDIDSFSFQVISQATLSVDSFFLLSGLLLSYLYFKECEKKKGKINWAYYYIHRFWRLTPAFAMLLGFYTTLWLHLGSGPFWPTETDKGNCKKLWWWNLLYIVNFLGVNENCMGWTWYLANDMQFYIISPVFLILLWKLPLVGIIAVGIVTVSSWIVTGVLSATNNFRLFMSVTENMQLSDVEVVEKNQWNFFNIIYDKPYCRIGPYLVGLLLGYAIYRTSGRQNFMKMWLLVIGWIVAAFIGFAVVFGTYHVEMGNITSAFYNALSRSAWSIALGWVIFVCLTGHAGPVNNLLSWKLWIPLSRLTYCAYLVHPMIMIWYYSSLQTMLHFQMNTMVLYYFGYLVFAYLIAFVASMTFESPMMALEKFILKKFSK